jgi:prepilin-type N-terminal cleavage/methylation domain-containing protein
VGEEGFTLIELVIVLVILPIVVGGIAVSLIGILENENSTFNRVADSADASITSANFARDVQNASLITTGSSGQCTNGGSPPVGGTALLGLRWSETNFRTITDAQLSNNATLISKAASGGQGTADFTPADSGATIAVSGTNFSTTIAPWNSPLHPPDTSMEVYLSQATTGISGYPMTVTISQSISWVVTYWDVPAGLTNQLVRMFCGFTALGKPTPLSQEILAHDLPANQGSATITCGPPIASLSPSMQCTPSNLASGFIPTAGITDVSLSAAEPASGYQFNLSATPRNSNPGSQGMPPGGNPSSLLLTGSGSANLNVPGTTDTLTVNGELAFNSSSGTAVGAGTLNDNMGSITEYNCTQSPSGSLKCPQVTSGFTGSCNCATPAFMATQISNPVVPIPTVVSSPSQTCSGVNATCQPGYYAAGSVTASGNVTFVPGNYQFAGDPMLTFVSSVSFGAGQYTFDQGLTIGPNVALSGSGVFFYLPTSGSLTVGTGDTVNLTPATSGPYIGVLVYQLASNTTPLHLGAGGSATVNTFGGAVEAPGAPIVLGSAGDVFNVGGLVATSVSLGSSSVNVTVGS